MDWKKITSWWQHWNESVSELSGKGFKAAVTKILHQLQIALEKVIHGKEIEVVKNNQTEMLELKDPICETLPDEEYSGHNKK